MPSPLLYRDRLFFIEDGGLASCYDAATGAPKYEQERIGINGRFYASPVAADGRIYIADLSGKAATLAAGDKPKVLWRGDFGERIAATPAIAGDALYVRTEKKLFAFKTAR